MVSVTGSATIQTPEISRGKIMEIELNGKKAQTQQTTLTGLLSEIELPKIFVVEKNGAVVYKENYETTTLDEGDIIEIASFCGGG